MCKSIRPFVGGSRQRVPLVSLQEQTDCWTVLRKRAQYRPWNHTYRTRPLRADLHQPHLKTHFWTHHVSHRSTDRVYLQNTRSRGRRYHPQVPRNQPRRYASRDGSAWRLSKENSYGNIPEKGCPACLIRSQSGSGDHTLLF